MQNPSAASRAELYDFLEFTKLPITSRGTFLAYRSISANWKDCHSGTMDNKLGRIVKMDRKQVDSDRNQTCSRGLHIAGQTYNARWNPSAGTILTIVEVDPKDVVSIPSDYNNQKGRCCKFKVLDVASNSSCLEDLWYFDAQPVTKDVLIERIQKTTWGKKLTKTALAKGATKEQLAVTWLKALTLEPEKKVAKKRVKVSA